MIEGEIEVEDIPALWNEKMHSYLGLDTVAIIATVVCRTSTGRTVPLVTSQLTPWVPCMRPNCLTVHASSMPKLSEDIAAGNLTELFHWLQQNIWRHASRYPTDTLITNATGKTLDPSYFRRHLESRYL
ncbi:Carboxypeptidase Taq (M32) metallopeptidase [Serratia fonticola]|uniref:Carboxypeptidase Taq (M32) metallopeptidase n=1 Tax=Serratia fonticola TaxID=47917 RepID=A0A4U9U6T3_SERFO|nr:Carboxypeptidase Taq (M32) metallopeptidase [Serratia fonticola]